MRKYILILLLLFNLSILNAQSRLKTAKKVIRKKIVSGPALPGKLSDCTDDNEVILGIYLLDDIYKSRYNNFLENGFGNPYIKVYSTKLTKGVYVDESTLVELSSVIRLLFDNYEESSVNLILNHLEMI